MQAEEREENKVNIIPYSFSPYPYMTYYKTQITSRKLFLPLGQKHEIYYAYCI